MSFRRSGKISERAGLAGLFGFSSFSEGRNAVSGCKRNSRVARQAFLSRGLFPEPHLGECIQEGQPASQGHFSTRRRVFSRSSSITSNARCESPTPPEWPSYINTAARQTCSCSGVLIP